jgi:glucose-6-phosphate isomerase/transaldolase/glucose-6-phosphate isomerase
MKRAAKPGSTDTRVTFSNRDLTGDGETARRTAAILSTLDRDEAIRRIWQRDATVWRDDPTEIDNRLGWLTVVDKMRPELSGIRDFADGLTRNRVEDVILLGMGGSSLAPEVLRRTFGSAPGRPRLHVLDSTSPAWIRRVSERVDPELLHVLVASKSGTTVEVQTLHAHFDELVRRAGLERGPRFSAITDPGTALADLAGDRGFARCFENPPDIGGRYSALSLFGLVPAAILGLDLEAFLERAGRMATACGGDVAPAENPGAVLGALLGACALAGRDKLSLLLSPSIASFGLWVEQLVAESIGKDGTGIVPVVGETIEDPARPGDDRVFVTVRVAEDEPGPTRLGPELAARGHPVYAIDLTDPLDLGAEMFRWEMATAVAGHVLGVHPFDQPDVQSTKARTEEFLAGLPAAGERPDPAAGDASAIRSALRPGTYVALMVFGDPDAGLEVALDSLRRSLLARFGVATTLGIGPRFLHSTGQLHKGGGEGGVFLQMVLEEEPLPIPDRPYGFRELLRAQADGDLAAIRAAGRRILRVPPVPDPVAAIRSLTAELTGP